MDLDDIVKEVDGKLVTKIDVHISTPPHNSSKPMTKQIDPPIGWTNDFAAVNGFDWADEGCIAEIIDGIGLKGKPKPLFGNEGEQKDVIFQAGEKLYVYQPDTEDVFRLQDYTDIGSLVSAINDLGYGELRIIDPTYP